MGKSPIIFLNTDLDVTRLKTLVDFQGEKQYYIGVKGNGERARKTDLARTIDEWALKLKNKKSFKKPLDKQRKVC